MASGKPASCEGPAAAVAALRGCSSSHSKALVASAEVPTAAAAGACGCTTSASGPLLKVLKSATGRRSAVPAANAGVNAAPAACAQTAGTCRVSEKPRSPCGVTSVPCCTSQFCNWGRRGAVPMDAVPCWACSSAAAAVGDRAAAVCKAELGGCAPDANWAADWATACIKATEPCCPASSCNGRACP